MTSRTHLTIPPETRPSLGNEDSPKVSRGANRNRVLENLLKQETALRLETEKALFECRKRHIQLLSRSKIMQEELRDLAHQVLSAQEEERKEISRELHDEIAQTLAGINVQLASLKESAALNTHGISRRITITQRLVAESVNAVHKFARDLRPAALDDLGLIPALRSFIKNMPRRRNLKISFKPDAGLGDIGSAKRTVLYRITQESLTNVNRHSGAEHATVRLKASRGCIQISITDNGCSFQPEKILPSRSNRRLGILGMRERVEMVGGVFSITSIRGKGTTVTAEVPVFSKDSTDSP